MRRTFTLFLFFTSLLTTLLSQEALNTFINHHALRTANIGVLIKDMKTGRVIAEHRSTKAAIPASTMKVVTAATALETMGPDFRYTTVLSYDGTLNAGILNGNLYITGSGDPTLGSVRMGDSAFLSSWIDAVRSAGIQTISGNIVGDDSRFDTEGANPKWTWDDIGNYYAPAIWGIAYKDNTVAVRFQSGAEGTTPRIISMTPHVPEMVINNQVLSTATTSDKAYFFGHPKQMERSVRGEIPANRPSFVVRAELPNPALMLAQDFKAALQAVNIEHRGKALDIDMHRNERLRAPSTRTVIHTHYSVPLADIITEVNVRSNNFYAEQVFKSISLSQRPIATNSQSIAIIQQYWRSKGLDVSELFMEDGSGLTPTNAVTPRFLVDLMQYMYKDSPHKNAFYNSLAIGGRTGTLAGLMKNSHLNGRMIGKSGTLTRVRAYTGYLIHDNQEWVFAVIVNNSATNSWQTLSIIEKFLHDITSK
jgi:D-alanyl-D-alanine carboxypeptidase/D-alanyl-D-alanine-endopeptidase (penicillin-binding protein 4)